MRRGGRGERLSSRLFPPSRQTDRADMVQGKISTYRLRSDLLEEYLQSQFPSYKNFNVQVGALLFHRAECEEGADTHAQLSADGKEFYTFDTPEALTEVRLDVSCR
jgi:hypothetical protein